MDAILNSPSVNWLLKLAFSKSGVVIRIAVGYMMGAITGLKIIPQGDLSTIQVNLTSGATALVALLYAWLNFWLNKRRADGAIVVQKMINKATPASADIPEDGVIGNKTILAAQQATGINAQTVVSSLK